MAHVEHYKMADVRRLVNEWSRDREYTCRDGRIDPVRTKYNYTMDDSDRYGMKTKSTPSLVGVLRARLGELTHSNRKDLNVLSDWVVTCPQELLYDEAKQRRFFEVTYSFLCDRYGRDNVLQGFIHLDETTAHGHFPVIPVKDGRVSSKAVFTRKELASFHTDLDRVMEREFGIKGLIKNGRTKGSYTVKELKERTKDEKALEDARAEKERLTAQADAERARAAQAVQERIEAEKRTEAILTAREEAVTKMADMRRRARQLIEDARAVVKDTEVQPPLDADDRRVLAAVRSWNTKNGSTVYDAALRRYAKDSNVPRIPEDAAVVLAERLAALQEMVAGIEGQQIENTGEDVFDENPR